MLKREMDIYLISRMYRFDAMDDYDNPSNVELISGKHRAAEKAPTLLQGQKRMSARRMLMLISRKHGDTENAPGLLQGQKC
jgi:hypothetical protein